MDNREEILITAKNYMERLIPGIDNISEKFINGEKEAMEDLLDVVEGIQYISKVLKLIEIKENIIEFLNSYLNEIINAIENEDYILIGDLMKYELIPVLLEVKSIIGLEVNN